jgi:hypothetical protein
MARISACAEAVASLKPAASANMTASVEIVAPQRLSTLLQSFDRIVVF